MAPIYRYRSIKEFDKSIKRNIYNRDNGKTEKEIFRIKKMKGFTEIGKKKT